MVKKFDKKKEAEETYTSADLKRYIGALMEENREQIKGISEQFIDFRRILNSHTEMLETHEQWFENIDRKLNLHTAMFEAHRKRFDLIDQSLDSHTGMLGVLAEDVSVLKEDMVIVKKDISIIKGDLKQKVDYKEFSVLERRGSAVEVK